MRAICSSTVADADRFLRSLALHHLCWWALASDCGPCSAPNPGRFRLPSLPSLQFSLIITGRITVGLLVLQMRQPCSFVGARRICLTGPGGCPILRANSPGFSMPLQKAGALLVTFTSCKQHDPFRYGATVLAMLIMARACEDLMLGRSAAANAVRHMTCAWIRAPQSEPAPAGSHSLEKAGLIHAALQAILMELAMLQRLGLLQAGVRSW